MNAATKTSPLPKRQPAPCPAPGVYENVSNSTYQKVNAMQSSGLKKLADSPLVYHHWLNTEDSETKGAFMFGIAVHARLLEPSRYAAECTEITGLKDGAVSATWAKHIAANPGRIILAEGWGECIETIAQRVFDNLDARQVLTDPDGVSEVMIVWRDDRTGLLCKSLLDRVTFTDTTVRITAVKTAREVEDFAFGKACWDNGYHLELAHSIAAARAAASMDPRFAGKDIVFEWLTIQSDEPYDVSVDDPDDGFCEVGQKHYAELMTIAARCYLNDRWPGVARTLGGEAAFRRTLALPVYALKQFNIGAGGGM